MISLFVAAAVAYFVNMIRPGTNIVIKDQPPATTVPTDTGTWFVCGLSEKGPTVPTLVRSMGEFVTLYGQRVAYGLLYDALDVFFREGGSRAYVGRVLGPAAAQASRNLMASAAISLVVKGKNPGDWANNLKASVIAGSAGGTYILRIHDALAADAVIEQSGDLVTQADAVSWSTSSQYVDVTIGASANPPDVAAAAALAGGTDDRSNILDAHWLSALDEFSKDLGPGQVSYPGRTSLTAQQQLLAHALPHNRVALVDLPDSGSRATLVTAAVALRGLNARFSGAFAPWAVVPGIVPGTTRTVPYSAVQAGIIARNDVELSAGFAAAGRRGQSRYAIGLSQPAWDENTGGDREQLNNAGVNVALMRRSIVQTYGFRTLVNPATDLKWIDLANSRLLMEIASLGDEILGNHIFDPIDGQGHLFAEIDSELRAMLNIYWTDGSLYGDAPDDAFRVDTGPDVNTPVTIAAHELHASVGLKPSPMAEYLELALVKVQPTDSF